MQYLCSEYSETGGQKEEGNLRPNTTRACPHKYVARCTGTFGAHCAVLCDVGGGHLTDGTSHLPG